MHLLKKKKYLLHSFDYACCVYTSCICTSFLHCANRLQEQYNISSSINININVNPKWISLRLYCIVNRFKLSVLLHMQLQISLELLQLFIKTHGYSLCSQPESNVTQAPGFVVSLGVCKRKLIFFSSCQLFGMSASLYFDTYQISGRVLKYETGSGKSFFASSKLDIHPSVHLSFFRFNEGDTRSEPAYDGHQRMKID